ncbi:MgtC/SapB family protein [Desulfotomaculum nigrificans]|uniref:MgtC/SapB family protein n=1 Tax=Desulfotomaculum nigrificans TaxID=1565 RepID=UPI0001FAE65D|nr:MgtC/SapB family protein [Desulfotomaculum nigrificans]
MIEFPPEVYFRVIFSVFVGTVLGLERTVYNKPAGVRTFSLVCLGSTLIMIVSINGAQFLGIKPPPDPLRVAAQIVTGIGFIGAGVIWNSENGVKHGITTAAELWVVSAIGMALGLGLYDLVLLVILCVYMAIFFGRKLDSLFRKGKGELDGDS